MIVALILALGPALSQSQPTGLHAVAEAAAGETVTITDRGRPVARMSAIPTSRLRALVEEGRARPARGRLTDLAAPEPGPELSDELQEMRDDERY